MVIRKESLWSLWRSFGDCFFFFFNNLIGFLNGLWQFDIIKIIQPIKKKFTKFPNWHVYTSNVILMCTYKLREAVPVIKYIHLNDIFLYLDKYFPSILNPNAVFVLTCFILRCLCAHLLKGNSILLKTSYSVLTAAWS